jgi:hypothetical protein
VWWWGVLKIVNDFISFHFMPLELDSTLEIGLLVEANIRSTASSSTVLVLVAAAGDFGEEGKTS